MSAPDTAPKVADAIDRFTRLYLTDPKMYTVPVAVWRELAGPVYPAMAGIGTTGLWQPEALIEILGVAVIPDERLVGPSR